MEKLIVGIDLCDTYTQAAVLGREEDLYIPCGSVRRFGEDIILVEQEPRPLSPHRR